MLCKTKMFYIALILILAVFVHKGEAKGKKKWKPSGKSLPQPKFFEIASTYQVPIKNLRRQISLTERLWQYHPKWKQPKWKYSTFCSLAL